MVKILNSYPKGDWYPRKHQNHADKSRKMVKPGTYSYKIALSVFLNSYQETFNPITLYLFISRKCYKNVIFLSFWGIMRFHDIIAL